MEVQLVYLKLKVVKCRWEALADDEADGIRIQKEEI